MTRLPLIDIVPRMRRMISHPERMRPAIISSVATGAVEGAALAALLPTISALASDEPVWGLGRSGWLVVLAVLSVLSFGLHYLTERANYAVALDFLRSLHRLVGDQVAKQPLGWFARPVAGALSRMVSTELMSAGEIFAHMFGPLVSRTTAAAVIIVAAWFWDPVLGFIMTVAVPAFIVITVLSTALMRTGRAIHEPREVALANRVVEYAQCQGAIRSCGRSDDYPALHQDLDAATAAKTKALWLETAGMLLSGMVTQGVIVVLITVTGSLAIGGGLAPVPALAFIGLALRFTSTLSAITTSAMALESRRPLLDGLDEVLTAQALDEPTSAAVLPNPGAVELAGVTFAYPGAATPALNNVSLAVEPGSMVAVVGPSGAGKSTIARLVCRFYDVDAGRISVGGLPVGEQTTAQLMSQLSLVFQDVYLFDDTLLANVRLGRNDASDDEIREAADLAGVTEIADRLPDGWDSRVGEGGRGLSGGERQRVSIARAVLKKAPIVLLDEATSALDMENESNIIATIERLRSQATVIVIAHRLSTIARADAIVALTDDGRVEAVGTHDELLAGGGTYAKFWQCLQSAQGWQLTN